MLKLNVDASVFSGSLSFSLGLILIYEKGSFICGRTYCVEVVRSVFEAVTTGVFEALSWTIDELQQLVIIETDFMLTTKALHNQQDIVLEVGSVLQGCQAMPRSREDVTVRFVKKQANKAAHRMA